MNEYKITQKEFAIWKAECLKWIKIFGLTKWEICFFLTENNEHLAWSVFNYHAKYAGIHLNKTWRWEQPPNSYELRKCAFHEVCEILIHPIIFLGECRYLSESEMSPAVHEIIHTLENVLWIGQATGEAKR